MIKTFFLAAILAVAYAAPLVTTRAGTSAVMMNKTQPQSDSNGCCYKENGVCCPAGNPCEQAGLPCGTSCCEVGITGKAADEDPKGILSVETLGVRTTQNKKIDIGPPTEHHTPQLRTNGENWNNKTSAQPHGKSAAVRKVCDSWYRVNGGCREQYRGQYNVMSEVFRCNDAEVYEHTLGTYYMFRTEFGTWTVSSRSSMEACLASGFIFSASSCTCPGTCTVGAWEANTGTDSSYAECNAPVWCTTGVWIV